MQQKLLCVSKKDRKNRLKTLLVFSVQKLQGNGDFFSFSVCAQVPLGGDRRALFICLLLRAKEEK